MNFNCCNICSKKIIKIYEIKSFPYNIYNQKKKLQKKKNLKIFFCKFCNHISISKINSQKNLYRSYKKRFILSNYHTLNNEDKNKKILEISKEIPFAQPGFQIDHKTISDKNYLKISKKYNKIVVNDCISNIYNIRLFFKKISKSLEDKGEIQISHHYGPSLIKNLNIDRVYFEHINNFSFKSLEYLANKYELKIIKFKLLEKKNFFKATLINKKDLKENKKKNKKIYNKFDLLTKNNIKMFVRKINQTKEKIKKDLELILSSKKNLSVSVYGYGASIGSISIIKFFGLETLISKLIDNYSQLRTIYLSRKTLKVEKKFHNNANNLIVINLAPRYKSKIKKKVFGNINKKITYIEVLPIYNLVKKTTKI